jgi:hypothetical protein
MNIADARDLIAGHATAAVEAGVPITYTDVPPPDITGTVAWCRITVKILDGKQEGFGDGVRKFCNIGILCIEFFAPHGDGGARRDVLAQIAKTYLENVRSSPIWYRNIRATDVGQDGGFDKINIYADFEFTDIH